MIFSKVNIEWFTYFIKMSEFIEKYAYVIISYWKPRDGNSL